MPRTTRFWVAVGSVENWETAFAYGNIWGLRATQQRHWEALTENADIVFFYATIPVGGVIGYGIVRTRLRQDSPLWPEERERNEVIWPLRFDFEPLSCFPAKFWREMRIVLPELKARARMGFQEVDAGTATELLRALPEAGPQLLPVLSSALALIGREVGQGEFSRSYRDPHKDIQQLLAETGRLQRYVADVEYPLERRRLDVVWRRVHRAVPSFVFEVQIGGNLTEGMGKLKQAFNLWNSNIFLVGKQEHRGSVNELLGGTFHEIQHRLRFLELGQVQELYQRKRAYRELETQLGILA